MTVLLTTEMFVGGCLAFILDNTVPGTSQPWEGNREPQWTHRQSTRSPELWPGQMQCRLCREKQGQMSWRETTGLIEAKFPLGLEEDVARRVIPGPHELFPCHFLVATGLRGAFVFLGQVGM